MMGTFQYLFLIVCAYCITGEPFHNPFSKPYCPGYILKSIIKKLPSEVQRAAGIYGEESIPFGNIKIPMKKFINGFAMLSDIQVSGLLNMRTYDMCNQSGIHQIFLDFPNINLNGNFDLKGTKYGLVNVDIEGPLSIHAKVAFRFLVRVRDDSVQVLDVNLHISEFELDMGEYDDIPDASEMLLKLIEKEFEQHKEGIKTAFQALLKILIITNYAQDYDNYLK